MTEQQTEPLLSLLYSYSDFGYNGNDLLSISMTIKAVFFDLYNTLVGYEPPREEIQAKALNDFGIERKPENLRWPLVVADEYIYEEHSKTPLGKLSEEERGVIWANYERIFLKEAGVEPEEKLIRGILGKLNEVKWKLVLFDDVAPTLTDLKNKGIILGLISNMDKDISPTLNDLGLLDWLTVIVTSKDADATKPQPKIFQEALRRTGDIPPADAIYVGDQYQADALGASKAGLKGVLLDRGDYFKDVTDCPRIQSLAQLTDLL